ncbi:type I restriction enzyme HsdR N-terminal domain-containing protein [Rubrivirga sp. S365]|uniref:Type I restriction enzyme HsdR N-terminal domain-containing protein n=1 Tax=Rubrivirga litoralis TaxID=3075598 RepID=A0ABU3BPV5_9BACT|nr:MULTISPECIES: type I restriction enzyme HsdR N-terminal domain-containing protein [unclassified Rubrivirga]MDT0631314.1 type I restriction enzyme HsdR N-terminal domain-containing protein [Rubrivirga sp. F394]MDT7855983.1 type I restriction enzyme HsdR N-terminal domain-containing protein [Rubrivirga sp. S365]
MSGADAGGAPGRGGLRTRDDGGRRLVHDPVRRRWVALTPEERVRQELLLDLVALGYPVGLLAVEKGLAYRGLSWRADVVAYGRDGRARLLAECKAPGVAIGQKTFDQLARYNAVLDAPALVVDNGAARYCCVRDGAGWRFVDALPAFGEGESR